MSKHVKVSILILLLSLNLFGCKKESVTLHIESDIEKISLSKNTENKKVPTVISNDKQIVYFVKNIQAGSKKTNKEAHNETPSNVDSYIKIEFYFFEGETVFCNSFVQKIAEKNTQCCHPIVPLI